MFWKQVDTISIVKCNARACKISVILKISQFRGLKSVNYINVMVYSPAAAISLGTAVKSGVLVTGQKATGTPP
jgi:hypothetical protein